MPNIPERPLISTTPDTTARLVSVVHQIHGNDGKKVPQIDSRPVDPDTRDRRLRRLGLLSTVLAAATITPGILSPTPVAAAEAARTIFCPGGGTFNAPDTDKVLKQDLFYRVPGSPVYEPFASAYISHGEVYDLKPNLILGWNEKDYNQAPQGTFEKRNEGEIYPSKTLGVSVNRIGETDTYKVDC